RQPGQQQRQSPVGHTPTGPGLGRGPDGIPLLGSGHVQRPMAAYRTTTTEPSGDTQPLAVIELSALLTSLEIERMDMNPCSAPHIASRLLRTGISRGGGWSVRHMMMTGPGGEAGGPVLHGRPPVLRSPACG